MDGTRVSLRPVATADLSSIDRWADRMTRYLSRPRPYAPGANRHDPGAGLHWHVIVDGGRDVGTIWIELLPHATEAVLGVYLGDRDDFGRGIGTAALRLAVAEFRGAHPRLPVALHVRRANQRAIACYRRVGFAIDGSGSKSLPSGEDLPYYRMVLAAP